VKMRHNKKRNPALLYEFLVRYVSKCLVDNQPAAAEKTLEIAKKYFGKGTALNEELRLFRNALDTTVKSRHSAEKVLGTICESAKIVNARDLDAEKSRLIKEINHSLKDPEFYSYKVPDYVVYASVSALVNESRNKKKSLSDIQKIQLEDVVCEHMVKEKSATPVNMDKNPKYNKAVYKFVFERFHKKYDQKLSEAQRKLLTTYAAFKISKNPTVLTEVLVKEIQGIRQKLGVVKDEDVRKDKALMDKIQECYRKFTTMEVAELDDTAILEVLRFMQLADEVES